MHLPDDMILTLKRCNGSRNNVAWSFGPSGYKIKIWNVLRKDLWPVFWVTHGEASSTDSLGTTTLVNELAF